MRVDIGGGFRLYFDVEGPGLVPEDTQMVERPTLILLHGGPGFDHTGYKPAFSQFADICQVIYLDHRGQGRSDRDTPDQWTLDIWADDVVRFCDYGASGRVKLQHLGWVNLPSLNVSNRCPDTGVES